MNRGKFQRRSVLSVTLGLLGVCAQAQTQTPAVVTSWDQFSNSGITAAGPAMDQLITQFEKENSGVRMIRTVTPSIGIRESYRLAVSAGKPPDLAYTWPAASVLAGYARDKKLAPLNAYQKQYGWKLDPFFVQRNSYGGQLYGVPFEQDIMGVYYNKAIFQKLNLKPPTTYAEFLSISEVLKKAGITPIAFGNRDQWPATNVFSLILGLTAGKKAEQEVLFGDAKWTRPEFVKAAQTFVDWNTKGYLPRGFNGIGFDESTFLFTSGKAAMFPQGSWVVQNVARDSKFEVGAFQLPPIGAVPRGTVWGEGSQFQISAAATQSSRDGAARFVNFLTAPKNRQVWVEKGYLVPIGTTSAELARYKAPQLVKDLYTAGLATPESNFYDLHTTLPERVTQVLYAELQSLLNGANTPEQFLQKMQTSWDDAIKRNERWKP